MTEEIFGPLLPVKTFRHIDEAIGYVNRRDKPLALYYFGDRRGGGCRVLDRTSSGGACVNDTIVHLANGRLPFGGVGESGFGKYHGRSSFDLFSHMRPVVRSSRLIRPAVEIRSVPAFETVPEAVPVNGLRSVEPVLVRRENPCLASGPKTTWGNSGAYRRAYSGRSTGTAIYLSALRGSGKKAESCERRRPGSRFVTLFSCRTRSSDVRRLRLPCAETRPPRGRDFGQNRDRLLGLRLRVPDV